MRRWAALLMLLVLIVFALPTLADSCADEKAALVQQAKALQAEIDQFNRDCGGTRSKSEYAAHNCAQRGCENR